MRGLRHSPVSGDVGLEDTVSQAPRACRDLRMRDRFRVTAATRKERRRVLEDIPRLGVGMVGYAFMGKAHANAYRTIPYMTWPPPMVPRLVRIAGRSDQAVAEAAERYGFAEHT